MNMYIYIYIYIHGKEGDEEETTTTARKMFVCDKVVRHRLNGYLAQRVPSMFLSPAVLGCAYIVKFLKVCFPGGLSTH